MMTLVIELPAIPRRRHFDKLGFWERVLQQNMKKVAKNARTSFKTTLPAITSLAHKRFRIAKQGFEPCPRQFVQSSRFADAELLLRYGPRLGSPKQ